MALIETVMEYASFKSVTLFIIGAWYLQFIVGRITEHVRIRRMGNYGKSLPYYWPFGSSDDSAQPLRVYSRGLMKLKRLTLSSENE